MRRSNSQLRRDALAIWQAGVAAVASRRLVARTIRVEGGELAIGEERFPLEGIRRIIVVGAGKAGAGMAAAVEDALGPRLCEEKQLAGIVNVPADCVRPLTRIALRAVRPAGVNEPTPAGVAATEEILRLVQSLGAGDLCLCLLSGGGSALLPAPDGVSLEEKIVLTRRLSAAGATIEELNVVRKQLSRIKGGGLARACRAGRLAALVISDVPGDQFDLIASGPTAPDSSTPEAALDVLHRYAAELDFLPRVATHLQAKKLRGAAPRPTCQVVNLVIGNNAVAVDASGEKAESLGYRHALVCATHCEGPAEDVGRHLAAMALRMRSEAGPDCLISGGEPVVRLVDSSRRGLGGRNQQLALAALQSLAADGAEGMELLSAGTDGEDGPTDAAGAFCDASVLKAAACAGARSGRLLGPERRLSLFRADWRVVEDRPLGHQRRRRPGGGCRPAWQGVIRRPIINSAKGSQSRNARLHDRL